MSEFLIVCASAISAKATPGYVADSNRNARHRNEVLGITGVVIFDGRHFLQYLEGPASSVRHMLELMRDDPNHEDFVVLHEGELDGERRFASWAAAYPKDDNAELLAGVMRYRGEKALQALDDILPLLDLY